MHSRRVLSFFLVNSIEEPQGEALGLIKSPSNDYFNWTLSSCNSAGVILCGLIEIGDVPGCNSIVKSTSLCGGNLNSSSRKKSSYSQTARGRPNSCLASSSKVRLANQPINYPCHLNCAWLGVKYHVYPSKT